MEAAWRGDEAVFDGALSGHASLMMSNVARCLFHGLTQGRLLESPQHGIRGHYYRQFSRMSLAFSLVTEVTLLTLGGSLKRRESLSGRLGDVLSLLYLGSAVLKHHYDNGSSEEELPLLEWACKELLYDIQQRLHEILDNFPKRAIAGVTRLLGFPTGRPFKRPSDRLAHEVAGIVLRTGRLRDHLTQGVYIPANENEPLAQLEDALHKATAAEPALRKLRQAMREGSLPGGDPEAHVDAGRGAGIITGQEASAIRSAVAARKIVIQVDEFLPEYLTKECSAWESKLDGVAGQSM
jgi:acyl-CoA dehydrogenase